MIALPQTPDPLPGDPNGKRLCELFGRYLWQTIQASMPDDATQKPKWQTNTRYPLKPRVLWSLWQDAELLVGVRFGRTTSHALIDLDTGSCYHSPEAIAKIRAALETIGITRTLLVRSSWSGGLHLYLPLPEAVNTFNLAVALKECLKAHGFHPKPGQLEIFPNAKTFGVGIFTEYNAHRLPLQPGSGSCLLNDALEPVTDNLVRFLWVWDGAAQGQDLVLLGEAMESGRDVYRKRPKRQSLSKAEAWKADLEAQITEGWTEFGQTNPLLKSIACYGRVFEQLGGEALIDYIVRAALNCPGYEQYCRHRSEIRRRASDWAQAAEKFYWPFGSQPQRSREAKAKPNGNEVRSQAAQSRIRTVVERLMALNQLPDKVRERVAVLIKEAGTSMQTLYRYKCLWHPKHLTEQPVTPNQARDTADLPEENADPVEPPEPPEMKVLHTQKKIMKCGDPLSGDVGSDPPFISPDRGVRGDEGSFPQASHALSELLTGLPIPLTELQDGVRHQVQRLGWGVNQITQFIAQKFDGRRRSQLHDNELLLLLYYLQNQHSEGIRPIC